MRTSSSDRSALGSTLLLVIILVGVLAAVGAAAVALSSRDRINASAKSRRDLMTACAAAAQVKLWAELSRYGPNWLGSNSALVTEFTLADGTRLGPLHYDQSPGSLVVTDVVLGSRFSTTTEVAADLTNKAGVLGLNQQAYRFVARCTVPAGNLGGPDRQLEVEVRIAKPL